MEKKRLISTDSVQEALTDALRRYVGKGKLFSVSDMALAAGVSEKTVYAVRAGELIPSFETLLRFAAALPPCFMSEVLAPAGLGGVERIDARQVDAPAVLVGLTAQSARVAERLRDGKFCHIDRLTTGPELIELARELEAQGRAMMERCA